MRKNKKIISVVTALAVMLSATAFTGGSDDSALKAEALTSLSAQDITAQMTIGWNLGNTLDCSNTGLSITASPKSFVTAWGQPEPTQELFQTVKNGGFNTVRIPTTWYEHIEYNSNTDTYEIDDVWLDYVKNVVDYAYDLDMFVILNVHHEDWVNVPVFTDETLATASAMMEDIWTQLSAEFSSYDQHLIFEGMNEPRQTGNSSVSEWGNGSGDNGYTWDYINTLNEIFIDTVRSNGSAQNNERLLMIPSYCATSDTTGINALEIPADAGNVAISVHAYAPYFFTMDTSSYANHEFPGKSGWGEDYDTNLKNLFSSLKTVSESKGAPIVIGEFSASDFENTESRVNWAKSYLSYAKDAGFPCVLWDNNVDANGTGEAHGYVYRLTNTWYPNSLPVVKAMMDTLGVTDYYLPEYTEYVPPTFSWDNISIGDDWTELYRDETGTVLEAWDNIKLSDWKQYINENYQLTIVYDATTEPRFIMQGGWYSVSGDASLAKDFQITVTYDDIAAVMTENGETLDSLINAYIGATSGGATIYGVYAVPVNGSPEVTTTTEITTTSETSVSSETSDSQPIGNVLAGDVNGDGKISSLDLVLLKQYLLETASANDINQSNADMNGDSKVTAVDLTMLKKQMMSV